jgi:transposase
MEFFKKWLALHSDHEYICFDVTSIPSCSKNIAKVEYGSGYQDTGLPQINVGMYFGQKSRIPLHYDIYEGSINDISNLEFIVMHTQVLGLKDIFFVMDRGFCSYKNINILYR